MAPKKTPTEASARTPRGAPPRAPGTPSGEARDPRVGFDGAVTGSFGVSGLKRNGIFLNEEFHPKLRGKLATKVYREMEDNSSLLGGALWGLESIIRQIKFNAGVKKEQKDSAGAKELADWYEGDRTDMETPFESVISEICSQHTYGWANLEELWKIRRGPLEDVPELKSQFDDGLFGTRDLAIRSQDSREGWEWDREGRVLGMWQRSPDGNLHYIDAAKSLLFRIRERKGSPEGRSLLRNCYRDYYFIGNLEEMTGMAVSRILNGVAVFELPREALLKKTSTDNTSLRDLAEQAIRQWRFDTAAGFVIPASEDRQGKTGIKLSLLSPTGTDPGAANPVIERHQKNMMIALLFQMLLLGNSQLSSASTAAEMIDMLTLAINAIVRSIAGVFTLVHYPRLGRLNNFDPRILPELQFAPVEKKDVLKMWQSVQAYTAAGGVLDENLDNFGREESGWPQREVPSLAPRSGMLLDPSEKPGQE